MSWNHIHCGYRIRPCIKKRSLLSCWRITGCRHTDENLTMTSLMLRRSVRKYRRWITQIIRDITTSNTSIHRRCLHEHVERNAFTCVADVFWDILNLGVPRRMFADCCALLGAVRRYIADGSWRRNIERKFKCKH